MTVKVTIGDRGYAKLMDYLRAQKNLEMTVGLHAEEAEGEAMAAAELNEFGSPGGMIPARPAITGWAADNQDGVVRAMRGEMEAAYKARKNPIQRLDQLAQVCAGDIQGNIAAGIDPPNAESTVRRKGSSTPLIDTGAFRSSIRGRVRERGGG